MDGATSLSPAVYISPMFDTICTLPLTSDLFAQAIHPTEPVVAVGLSSGHVAALKLPPVDSSNGGEEDEPSPKRLRRSSDGTGTVDTAWRTKRHKGSCRCLGYSLDGRSLYSAGTDGILKAADAESGKVIGKVAVPLDPSSSNTEDIDAPTVVHALSPQTLLLSTDSGALHLYDLRDPAPSISTASTSGATKTAFTTAKPAQTHHPHTDYISSLTPLPPSSSTTSGYSKQFLTTGGTTLALTDLRRGVLVKSEDQEELLLSSLYTTAFSSKKGAGSTGGEKALIGGGDGVITLWEKGQWDDQDERIIVSREKETVDSMALVPDGMGGFGRKIVAGLGDGKVRVVRLGLNKVVGEVMHDEVEGVVGLGFDVGGRMISGGGQTVKVWEEHVVDEDEDEDEDEGVDGEVIGLKRGFGSDDDDERSGGESSEEEEVEKVRKRRKKRKKGKGPKASSGFNFSGLD